MFRSNRLRHGLTLFLTTTTIIAATGCGGKDQDPSTSKQAGVQAQVLKFAKCMREHGVDMPDPQVSADGGGVAVTKGAGMTPSAQTDAALEACKDLRPKAPTASPGEQQASFGKALKTAKCMREHGVDMRDPLPDGTAQMAGVDPESPAFQAALKACGGTIGGRATMPAPAQ
jgi:hypothetical protein